MTTKLCGVAVSVCVVLASIAAGVSAQTPARPDPMERFSKADKNQDGRLDREEFQLLMVETFYFMDKDKKGYLVIQDIREVRDLTPDRFRAADANGDGRLTLQEFLNAAFKDFDAADLDKDGTVSMQELQIYIRRSGN